MIRAWCTIAALATLAGCAGPPAPAGGPDAPLLAVERTLPAEGAIAVDDAFPPGLGATAWRAARGADPPTREAAAVEVSLRDDDAHGAARARSIEGEAVEFLTWNAEGIDLFAVLSTPDAAVSIFATPLRLMPPSLAAGAEHRATAAMEVVDAGDPRRRKDRGTGERIARYVRDAEVVIGGRRLRAKVLDSTFTARLGAATATRTTELFVVAGLGPVAERWTREVVVFGLVRTVREGVRVRDLAAAP